MRDEEMATAVLVGCNWVSEATRQLVAEEVLAGGWFSTLDPIDSADDPTGERRSAQRQELLTHAGKTVDEAVRGFFGTLGCDLAARPGDSSFELSNGETFTEQIAGCILARLPMSGGRDEPFLASLHRDMIDEMKRGGLRSSWYEPTEVWNGVVVLQIDRAKLNELEAKLSSDW